MIHMKWEDLEVGDLVKINEKNIKLFKEKELYNEKWIKNFCYKNLKIESISIHNEDYLNIIFEKKDENCYINKKSGKHIDEEEGEDVFLEIVKVKK